MALREVGAVIYEQIAMQRLRPIDINQPATRSEFSSSAIHRTEKGG